MDGTDGGDSEGFYLGTEPFADFAKVVDASVYRPLPAGWWLGLTDVVGSTEAIEAGHYKRVNMAGATAISAVMNAIGHRNFPFVFGGDGASLAVPPEAAEATREALARTARWVEEELGLELRAAMVPVDDARAAGHEVLMARFAASDNVCYAMFAGHGLAWAEEARQRGVLAYGLWEQPAALMTCIVPSPLTHDHMHFLDGAEGGYACAALQLKAQLKEGVSS